MHPGNLRFRFICLIVAALTAAPAAARAEDAVEFTHQGITIAGKPKPKGKFFDIEIVSPGAGAARVKEALDLLYEASPYNRESIEKLKSAGNVVIMYDPAFPARELTKVTIAAFMPEFYQATGKSRDFVAIVGRFGAKWSARELAPVLAHELTGHGIQHLRGRLENVREVDLECEAYLFQEKAYQDMKFDKGSRDMIAFRQQLERHWCADFRNWQRVNRPEGLAAWDKLNPDVPKILDDYLVYIGAMRQSGVARRAVDRAKAQQATQTTNRLDEMMASGDPEDMFQLGLIYTRGIGVDADDTEATDWFAKAAEAGHAMAQFELARRYWRGDGVVQDKASSAVWAKKAAEGGVTDAAQIYGSMLLRGEGVSMDREAAAKWLKVAASKGNRRARALLNELEARQ